MALVVFRLVTFGAIFAFTILSHVNADSYPLGYLPPDGQQQTAACRAERRQCEIAKLSRCDSDYIECIGPILSYAEQPCESECSDWAWDACLQTYPQSGKIICNDHPEYVDMREKDCLWNCRSYAKKAFDSMTAK